MKLRFSIRDLLWLTLLAAVLVAWWVDHRKLTENFQRQISVFEIKIADPAAIQKVLQDMYAGRNDIRIEIDEKTKRLTAIYSSENQGQEISAIVEKLDEEK